MNKTNHTPDYLPTLVKLLLGAGGQEQGHLDDLVAAVKTGDQAKVLEQAEALARHREARSKAPENCPARVR